MEELDPKDPFKTKATLIQKLKDPNNDEAWERFVNTYNAFIFSVIYRMRLHSSDAEEVSQKVSLKVWSSLPKTNDEIKSFRSWLAKITHNTVLDFIRERKSRKNHYDQYSDKKEIEYLDSIKVFKTNEIEEKEWEVFLISKAMKRIESSFQEQALEILKGDKMEIR